MSYPRFTAIVLPAPSHHSLPELPSWLEQSEYEQHLQVLWGSSQLPLTANGLWMNRAMYFSPNNLIKLVSNTALGQAAVYRIKKNPQWMNHSLPLIFWHCYSKLGAVSRACFLVNHDGYFIRFWFFKWLTPEQETIPNLWVLTEIWGKTLMCLWIVLQFLSIGEIGIHISLCYKGCLWQCCGFTGQGMPVPCVIHRFSEAGDF